MKLPANQSDGPANHVDDSVLVSAFVKGLELRCTEADLLNLKIEPIASILDSPLLSNTSQNMR